MKMASKSKKKNFEFRDRMPACGDPKKKRCEVLFPSAISGIKGPAKAKQKGKKGEGRNKCR